ncbi:LLM class flavin-dependent oxidoreductase [Amycolatopsis anabasis]|uniref:LLM class flavin-dependent oxidoreductase n=1 Tax=Amycolatopsis anabasis TaxID=1840409 RepID=UPI00131E66A5|nr:LLM class flavin-dependent oxidoreductase [Amycolatopsis anabasis]
MPVRIGAGLPTFGQGAGNAVPDIPALARAAEQSGLDAVWAGDHLSTGNPFLESTVALAAAAAVTERLSIGFGVLLLALRQEAWAAKQLGSLQCLSRNRLLLGVGTGAGSPGEWAAAGIPRAERGRRTDAMLAALPRLLAGDATELGTVPGAPVTALHPAVAMPPLWIGGGSDRAFRRVLDHGAGWLSSLLAPEEFAHRLTALSAMAARRGLPAPDAGTTVFAAVSRNGHREKRDRMARFLGSLTGRSPAQLERLVVSGPPEALAERLDEYRRSGARTFVVHLPGPDWARDYELLAEARALLVPAVTGSGR